MAGTQADLGDISTQDALSTFQEIEHALQHREFDRVESALVRLQESHSTDIRFHRSACRLLLGVGDRAGAVAAAKAATQSAAADANDWHQYGDCSRYNGQLSEAANAYAEALSIAPERADSAFNLAAVAHIQNNLSVACYWYAHALRLAPTDGTLVQYADALFRSDQLDTWSSLLSQITQVNERSPELEQLSVEINQYLGQYTEVASSLASMSAAMKAGTAPALDSFEFIRLYFDQTAEHHASFYQSINSALGKFSRSHERTAAVTSAEHSKPLRVGYLSADFRDHVMGRMALVMLEHRDRVAHKAICYGLNANEDAVTAQFQRAADAYVRCAGASDEVLAQRIVADKLDILVDLSGPTAGARSGVLARKPAPVIITHVAAAGPIGLSAVDYKLTDSICDLPENQSYLIEKLLPMAGCCYPVPKYPLPTRGLTRAELGLEGKVTLGAFFTYMKLSERCVRLWRNVLDAIPNAVIVFSPMNEKHTQAYENIMRAVDIRPEQFRFLKAGPTVAEQLARYRVIDFVIDSMPYGGVNGTLEALYMGVPVVTLLGSHHSERTTASMLNHLGVTDTIAQSPSEYVQIARKLASDEHFRQDIITRIRARWPKFADPNDYASRWEALLRKVAR